MTEQLEISDASLISKHNLGGTRPLTQDDLDQLLRDRKALYHLLRHVRILIPTWITECDAILNGTYVEPGEISDLAKYMQEEDERTEAVQDRRMISYNELTNILKHMELRK